MKGARAFVDVISQEEKRIEVAEKERKRKEALKEKRKSGYSGC